jgi:hypothetical membrane protein
MSDVRNVTEAAPAAVLARVAAAGTLLFVVLVIVGGMFYEGYSHVDQAISELGGVNAPNAWLQNLNFLVLGLAAVALAAALAAVFPQARAGAALVAGFGLLSCIANAAFPCDDSCAGITIGGFLHNLTGVAGFASCVVGMGLLARHWRRVDRWRGHAALTVALAAVAIAGLVVFLAMEIAGAQGVGVPQRIFVGALLVWLLSTALRIGAGLRPREQAASAPA